MAFRLPEVIREARALSAERDRLEEAVARRWALVLRGQGLSAEDLEELWAGLAEEVVRELLKAEPARWTPESVRHEAVAVIARVRARVEGALAEPDNG